MFPSQTMSTSLWPALLAAIVGGGGGGGRPAVEEGGMGSSMGPIQSLLALSVLGEHALYWWIGLLCFIGLGRSSCLSISFHPFRHSEFAGYACMHDGLDWERWGRRDSGRGEVQMVTPDSSIGAAHALLVGLHYHSGRPSRS